MELNLPAREIVTSSQFQSVEFYVPPELGGKLAEVMLNGLYESQTRFVMELSANAADANPGQPFELHLPTRLEPWFEVRDHGPGMSPEFMLNDYAQILRSTKDQDNQAIGGWGIGRLSALAISDSYLVTTRYQGQEYQWSVFRNGRGMPTVAHIHTKPTNETGVSVRVDVPREKIDEVCEAANGLRFFDPQPQSNFPIEPLVWFMRGNEWGIVENVDRSYVIMGGYAYPVTQEDVQYLPYEYRNLLSIYSSMAKLVLFLPIGSCDVTTNRERLKDTPKTRAAMSAAMKQIKSELGQRFQKEYDDQPTTFDAMIWYNTLRSRVFGPIVGLVMDQLKRSDVSAVHFSVYHNEYKLGRKDQLVGNGTSGHHYPGKKGCYFIRDLDEPRRLRKWLLEGEHDTAYVFDNDLGIQGLDLIPISSLDPVVRAKPKRGITSPVSLKYWNGRGWENVGPNATFSAIVPISNGTPLIEGDEALLKDSYWIGSSAILGVPKTFKGEVPDLPLLKDFIADHITSVVAQHKLPEQLQLAQEISTLSSIELTIWECHVKAPALEEIHNIKSTYLTLPPYSRQSLIDALTRRGVMVTLATPFGIKEKIRKLIKDYPLLPFICRASNYIDSQYRPQILEYLK